MNQWHQCQWLSWVMAVITTEFWLLWWHQCQCSSCRQHVTPCFHHCVHSNNTTYCSRHLTSFHIQSDGQAKLLFEIWLNPLTPTVAVWVQLKSILCQTGLSRHLKFLTSGHSDAHPWASEYADPWASECPGVKNYKWRLNPVWHKMLYNY